jgi:hypothetical protein
MAAHPQRLAEADARLNEATERVAAAKDRLKASQEVRRTLDKDTAVYQARISKFRDQQAAVKTNKEFQALGHEMETAARDLAAVEEKVLEQMMDADVIAADIKQAETALAKDQKEIDAEKAVLTKELSGLEAALAKASEARAALVAQTDPKLLAKFEQVAKARKGIAICAATRDGLCSACHVRLRPQVFQEVRRNDDIIQCFSCNRILYYVPPPAQAEPAVTHTN